MPQPGFVGKIGVYRGQEGLEQRGGFVDDGRLAPFEERGVGSMEQAQGLIQIPAADIQLLVDGKLQHIPALFQPQVSLTGPDVDETHIVIAVGRGKAPSAAARFDGVQNGDAFCFFQLLQLMQNAIPHDFPPYPALKL